MTEETGHTKRAKLTRRRECRGLVRRAVSERLPELLEVMLEHALKGSYAHTRLLMAMSGFDEMPAENEAKRKSVDLAALLMGEMEKRKGKRRDEKGRWVRVEEATAASQRASQSAEVLPGPEASG